MRDDELRRRLTQSNAWWRAAAGQSDPTAWVKHDRLLREKRERDIGFRATILDDIATGPVSDALVLLRGPRRVGKSVTVRELAASLCRRADLDPRQIVSFSCDEMAPRDIRRMVTLARELTRAIDTPTSRKRVWLLDEVGQVRGWTAALKSLRDETDFGDDTVVATSSSWRDEEDVEGNLLAGRAGSSGARRIRLLMPMTFRDFALCTRHELIVPPRVRPDDLQTEVTRRDLEGLAFDVDAYDLAWQSYLTSGGFPRAVAAWQRSGLVESDFIRDLSAWLRRDVDPNGPADSLPVLLEGLHLRSTSPLNITKAAEALGYSRDMFQRRIHRLVGSFGALWSPQRDDRGRTVPGSQPKLYLTDPLLAWLPSSLRQGLDAPDFTKLTEQTLAVSLARCIDDLEEGRWIANDTVGYVRTGSGNEVDLCPVQCPGGADDARTVPIESKWVDTGWRSEARTIDAKYRRGIVATKSILDISRDVWAVPAPILALLLG